MSDDYSLYERMCGNKFPHEDRQAAIKQAQKVHRQEKGNVYLKAYECFFCGKWHIGNVRRQKKKKHRNGHLL